MTDPNKEYEPTIPPMARTAVYVTGLVTGFVAILANGIVAAVSPENSTMTLAITGTVGTAVGWLSSALGTVYRPTQ